MSEESNLTGVWNGLYTYTNQPGMPESHFVAVILHLGSSL